MKKSVKIIMVIMAILAILVTFSSNVFAQGTMINAKDLDSKVDYGNSSDLQNMAGKVMGIIRNVAVIAGVIVLMIIGVKFILGSAEEKAEYKKSLIPLIVGIVVVMAATTIVSFIFVILFS